ncbi:uncharacterized protein LOC142240113 [Haematobia irritans]|uniref:uncharacterized protein LOC142240113 n=1 Tax=Haematobia irritans TaxID=7368 RepID=UPI003F5000B5
MPSSKEVVFAIHNFNFFRITEDHFQFSITCLVERSVLNSKVKKRETIAKRIRTMSTSSKFAMAVGIFSTIWHFFMAVFLSFFSKHIVEIAAEDESAEAGTKVDPKTLEMIKEYMTGFLALGVVVCIVMIVVSVLLVVGAKKQIPHLVAPWIYITVIALVLQIVSIFVDADDDSFLEIVSALFYAGIWFPIYNMYKKMVKAQKSSIIAPISSPVNPHFATYAAPVAVPADFSHTAKFVQCETKVPVAGQHTMYPDVPAPCNFNVKV